MFINLSVIHELQIVISPFKFLLFPSHLHWSLLSMRKAYVCVVSEIKV